MTGGRPDLVVIGRIATLGGDQGFGWAEGMAIAGGRVIATGRADEIRALARPGTGRLELAPDEVAIPGLTDAHLHLADAAMAVERVDLADAPTYPDGLDRIAAAHRSLPEGAWLQGLGWDAERWGGWPSADDLDRVAPGRRVSLWAHDHHALWVSGPALAAAGIAAATPDPEGGVIRRDDRGRASGILHETAARLVTAIIPAPTVEEQAAAIARLAPRLVAAGLVAVHDPGTIRPDPGLELAFEAYRRVADRGGIGLHVHACLRQEALDTALAQGLRSGDPLGDARGDIRVGWVKMFADGTLGSRTAAMLAPFEDEPGRPPAPGGPMGMWVTAPEVLAELAARAATGGLATQIHAIGDGAVRSALDALVPTAGRAVLMPRLEHVQLVDPADLPRFSEHGIAASIQPIHLRSDADTARRVWGSRAERAGYPWASLARSGALIPFGTDAPVEPWDPWPGIALSVTRREAGWSAAFAPSEALDLARALRAACLDGARSAGESDRGRLVPGHRADVLILDAAALDPSVIPGGELATTRPRLVMLAGEVVTG